MCASFRFVLCHARGFPLCLSDLCVTTARNSHWLLSTPRLLSTPFLPKPTLFSSWATPALRTPFLPTRSPPSAMSISFLRSALVSRSSRARLPPASHISIFFEGRRTPQTLSVLSTNFFISEAGLCGEEERFTSGKAVRSV